MEENIMSGWYGGDFQYRMKSYCDSFKSYGSCYGGYSGCGGGCGGYDNGYKCRKHKRCNWWD